jgi:hypothetical protein
MTKLKGLTSGIARSLGVPEQTVYLAARGLRENGLIQTGPRGTGAPTMGPTDAVNILLALMWNEKATSDHLRVPELRAAELQIARCNGKHTTADISAEYPFLYDEGVVGSLGTICDQMVDFAVRHGGVFARHFSLTLSRPGTSVTLSLHDDENAWDFRFMAFDSRYWERSDDAADAAMVPLDTIFNAMNYSTGIGVDSLWGIANTLRGRKRGVHEDLCVPPYCIESRA